MAAQRRDQRQARPRQPVAVEQLRPRRLAEPFRESLAAGDAEAERGVAYGPGNEDAIPGRAPERETKRVARPKAVMEMVSGPGVAVVSPP